MLGDTTNTTTNTTDTTDSGNELFRVVQSMHYHKNMDASNVCFFYNMGGCYRKDGSEKPESECKYWHLKVQYPVTKPQHYRSPCSFYHLNGKCDDIGCKYGHTPNLNLYRRNQYIMKTGNANPFHVYKEWIGYTTVTENIHPNLYIQPEILIEIVSKAVRILADLREPLSNEENYDNESFNINRKEYSKKMIDLIMKTTTTILNLI